MCPVNMPLGVVFLLQDVTTANQHLSVADVTAIFHFPMPYKRIAAGGLTTVHTQKTVVCVA